MPVGCLYSVMVSDLGGRDVLSRCRHDRGYVDATVLPRVLPAPRRGDHPWTKPCQPASGDSRPAARERGPAAGESETPAGLGWLGVPRPVDTATAPKTAVASAGEPRHPPFLSSP